ncbi:hypothetical protein ACLOAV_010630 [Pseudogymnoascus australis]
MALKPENPTRIQPPRAAKTPLGGRVVKTPTSPKKPKSPKKEDKEANRPKKRGRTEGSDTGTNIEETNIEETFVNEGRDNFLKESDIVVGNIISTGYHEAWSPLQGQKDEYKTQFVRESGDNCGYVHTKYRKFVIVARFTRHFLALPIYSHRFSSIGVWGDNAAYAEILDSTMKGAILPRPRPLCRGNADNIWLWSKAYSAILDRKWARMDDSSVAWMARPVAFENTIRAKVVSKLEKESEEQLLRWSRDCLLAGLEEQVREHLRVLRRENVVPPAPTGPNPWGDRPRRFDFF